MKIITLTVKNSGKKLHLNANLISAFEDIFTGTPSECRLVHIGTNEYPVRETCEQILQLIQCNLHSDSTKPAERWLPPHPIDRD